MENESSQRDLRSLIQPEITIQRPFKSMDIDYDRIKYEIERMKRV